MKRTVRSLFCAVLTLVFVLGCVSSALAAPVTRDAPADLNEIPDYHGWNSAVTYNLSTSTGGKSVAIGFLKYRLDVEDAQVYPPTYAEARDSGAPVTDIPAFTSEENNLDICTGMVLVRPGAGAAKQTEDIVIVYGDVIGTGKFSLSQVVRIAAIYTNPENFPYYQVTAGDWDGNGTVGLTDVVREARYYLMASAPDLTVSDYEFRASDGITLDLLDWLEMTRQEALSVWAGDGESSAEITDGETARGIRLGDDLQTVRNAYGFGWISEFDPTSSWFQEWTANDPALRTFLTNNAATRLVYDSIDYILRIEMFFDAQDQLIAISFFCPPEY